MRSGEDHIRRFMESAGRRRKKIEVDNSTKRKFIHLLHDIDTNGDGKLSWEELNAGLERPDIPETSRKLLREVVPNVDKYDVDGDGMVDVDGAAGLHTTRAQYAGDSDGDGDDLLASQHQQDHFSKAFSPGSDVSENAFGTFNPWDATLYMINREWAAYAGLLRQQPQGQQQHQ